MDQSVDLRTITYWSINKSDISMASCIFISTALLCFASAVYVDKHVTKIQDLKNARLLQLDKERTSGGGV